MCTACEQEAEDDLIQRAPRPGAAAPASATPSGFDRALQRARAAQGRPLAGDTLEFMQSRFGARLDRVRLHDDARAAHLAERIHARAFTVGRDIFFNQGEYRPEQPAGRRLLAHELTHTLQQQGSSLPIQRSLAARAPSPTTEAVEQSPDPGIGAVGPRIVAFDVRGPTPLVDAPADGLPCALVPRSAPVTLAVTLADVGEPAVLRVSEQTVNGSLPLAETKVEAGGPGEVAVRLLSPAVGQQDHVLGWDLVRADGSVQSLQSTVLRAFHSLAPPAGLAAVEYRAAERATAYARGARSGTDAAAALRRGIRGRDRIDYNPNARRPASALDLYDRRVGNCVHFSDLLALLARTLGIPAKHVILRGGFVSGGQAVNVLFAQFMDGAGSIVAPEDPEQPRAYAGPLSVENNPVVSLVDVPAGRPQYSPGSTDRALLGGAAALSAADRWAFSFHCIVQMAGSQHDAALDVEGFRGRAYLEGLRVEFIEPARADFGDQPVGPDGGFMVRRKQHAVRVLSATWDAGGGQLPPERVKTTDTDLVVPPDSRQVFAAPVLTFVSVEDNRPSAIAPFVQGTRITLPPGESEVALAGFFTDGADPGPRFTVRLRRK
ncbi:DUF4157 domain-containing protein [Nannocystis sp. ILAH1]|uniref:eCIS core domain-containing protein n=1 Tax=Nannocystis sp. ILAH1 TaxID=2996789 RepID=UPI00227204BE|nr:DUF4157 domain-containing protein [Nannocystis sp. ILAH1]MCY0987747.1 DUF4157 domain-containing protein [Nannocystis sp. ILAH1]